MMHFLTKSHGFRSSLPALLCILIAPAVSYSQQTRHVPSEYPTIQAGIDAAQDGDTVLVADGDYSGSGNVELNFNGKAITVRGDDSQARINDQQGGRWFVRFRSGDSPDAVLEGFVVNFEKAAGIVINGSRPSIRDCALSIASQPPFWVSASDCAITDVQILGGSQGVKLIGGQPSLERVTITENDLTITDSVATLTDCVVADHDSVVENVAGGITISESTVTLTRCTIRNNKTYGFDGYSTFGGGVQGTNSSINFIDCEIINNIAFSHFDVHGQGGGVYLLNCDSTFVDCLFDRNGCGTKGGGVYVEGGDAFFDRCMFNANNAGIAGGGVYGIGEFIDCQFENNFAGDAGGGVFLLGGTVLRCIFRENRTTDEWYEDYGGGSGLRSDPGPTVVLDSLFANNVGMSTDALGGGMYSSTGDVIRGCTFVDNHAQAQSGGIYFAGEGSTMANCTLWGNTDQTGPSQIHIEGAAEVSWCCVQGGFAGDGNMDQDPRFIDPDNGDYRLGNASPCIDAGNNALVPGESEADLDGLPRHVNDLGMPDIGEGEAPIVDMGCYEHQDRSTGLNLRVAANCPDGGDARIGWANGTPNGQGVLVFARTTGQVEIPKGLPCSGTRLGLGTPGLRVVLRRSMGDDGHRVINAMVPDTACGGFLQLIDLDSCIVSEVVQIR